jgi:hypothetical protein
MAEDTRYRELVFCLRVTELLICLLLAWAEVKLRTWTPVGFLDLPGKAFFIAGAATCLSAVCLLVRLVISLESRLAKVEASMLLILIVFYPLRLMLWFWRPH